MAEHTPRPANTDRERLRGSLAMRELARVRAVMKSRRKVDATTRAPASSREDRNVAVRMVEPPSIAGTGAEMNDIPDEISEQRGSSRPGEVPAAPLATLSSIESDVTSEDDTYEPLLPMRSGRSGLSTEKAQHLFAQHGFHYEPRSWRPQQGPPNKIRRMDKPIRIRVHYTCHECKTRFGVERTCLQCGHHRCQDCSRDPPRKVQILSDDARMSMDKEQAASAATPSAGIPTAELVAESEAPLRSAPKMLTGPLGVDESDEYSLAAMPQDYEFTMYTRPRAAVHTVWKAKARPCLQKHSHSASSTSPEDEAPMVQAVQRVYRRPRQRVRYTCENCETLFIAGDRCHECGHVRCSNCQREPPKRTANTPDPALLEAVAARLARYGHGQPSGITVSAG